MKHPLYLVLALSLFSCSSRDSSQQTEVSTGLTANTNATPKPTAPDSSLLIVPGERIGQVQLDMTAKELHSKLGKADSGDAATGKALNFWVSKHDNGTRHYVAVYTVNNFNGEGEPPKVDQVQVTSPQFQTATGISTGMPLPEIKSEFNHLQPLGYYTNQTEQQVYVYDDRAQGIAFEITVADDSTCTAITIHKKGEDISSTYLPIHPDMTQLK